MYCAIFCGVSKEMGDGWRSGVLYSRQDWRRREMQPLLSNMLCAEITSPCFAHKTSHLTRMCVCGMCSAWDVCAHADLFIDEGDFYSLINNTTQRAHAGWWWSCLPIIQDMSCLCVCVVGGLGHVYLPRRDHGQGSSYYKSVLDPQGNVMEPGGQKVLDC